MPTVRGRERTDRFFAQLPTQIEGVLRGAGRAGGRVLADEIELQTPSDEVRENVRVRTQAGDGRIVVKVDVKPGWARTVANWLEYGTSPHFISVDDRQRQGMSVGRINRLSKEAENSHSLVIGGEFVGSTVFHPGARPHPTFRPALDNKGGEAIAAAQGYISSRVKRSGIVAVREAGDDA